MHRVIKKCFSPVIPAFAESPNNMASSVSDRIGRRPTLESERCVRSKVLEERKTDLPSLRDPVHKMSHTFFQTPIPHYVASYDSETLRGISGARPWDIRTEIVSVAADDKHLLDIGCGTSFKLLPLANAFKTITALDISPPMVEASKRNFLSADAKNASVVHGDGEILPFEDASFDVVTAMLSRWHVDEIYRVLRPGGWAIVEMIGSRDKDDIKKEFGSDDKGLRGQHLQYGAHGLADLVEPLFREAFQEVTVIDGSWPTYLTRDGLIQLLTHTPTVRGFDLQADQSAFSRVCSKYSTARGIVVYQNRILVKAKKI